MRRLFIAGNWKMNMTAADAVKFISEIKDDLVAIENIDIAFCPTFLSVPAVSEALAGTSIGVGAQNMYFEPSGAYTGEVSPAMVAEFCQYVILGHSERRGYFGETDQGVNQKAKAALAAGLTPIICVGETLDQNEAGETTTFVSGQVANALDGLTGEQVSKLVMAYEPIWAIGTGRTASAEDANAIIGTAVRGTIENLFGSSVSEKVRIQYGGSVKPSNVNELMGKEHIDGALVGGASLKSSFVELLQNAL